MTWWLWWRQAGGPGARVSMGLQGPIPHIALGAEFRGVPARTGPSASSCGGTRVPGCVRMSEGQCACIQLHQVLQGANGGQGGRSGPQRAQSELRSVRDGHKKGRASLSSEQTACPGATGHSTGVETNVLFIPTRDDPHCLASWPPHASPAKAQDSNLQEDPRYRPTGPSWLWASLSPRRAVGGVVGSNPDLPHYSLTALPPLLRQLG